NNPLATVMLNLELANQDLAETVKRLGDAAPLDELVKDLRDAHEGAGRVRQIVRDLRIFSRAEEEKVTAVKVEDVLESTLRMAWNAIRHRARLVKQYTPLSPVRGNESRLGQVFLNLIVNAAQACEEGRADRNEIRVRTGADEPGSIWVDIEDTGSGMSPEVVDRLFTPFFTTKPPGVGTGLGLTVCQRLINGGGGSRPGGS